MSPAGFALIVLSPLVSAGQLQTELVYTSDPFGFRVARPDDTWAFFATESQPGALFTLSLFPRGTKGVPSLVVYVSDVPDNVGAEQVRDAAHLRLVGEGALQVVSATLEIAGREAYVVRCRAAGVDGALLDVEYAYLGAERYLYTLQAARAADDANAKVALDAMTASFHAFAPTSPAPDQDRAKWAELARRCGGEIAWCGTWKEASERAAREDKLILAVYENYAALDLPHTALSGPFSDPDMVALVHERFVALRLEPSSEAPFRSPDAFGLSPHSWGTSFLFVDAEGRVLAETGVDNASFLDSFARAVLASYQAAALPAEESGADPEDLAAQCLRRGEIERAEELLERARSPLGHQLRARLYRRQRKGKEALAEIRAARRTAGSDLEAELGVDEAVIHMRMGDYEMARRSFEAAVQVEATNERAGEAMFWLGAFEILQRGLDGGAGWWKRLVDHFPESPWAAKAAANLLNEGAFICGAERLDWPEEELFAFAAKPLVTPGEASRFDRSEREAVDFLLSLQRPDGSWPVTSDAFGLGSKLFTPAVTAICGASLIPFDRRSDVARAVGRALERVLANHDAGVLDAGSDMVGVYSIWGRTFTLWFLARCSRARIGNQGVLAAAMDELALSIQKSQHAGGGWPYVTFPGDPAGAGLDPSSSFLTAGVVLALLDARAARTEVPQSVLDAGLAFLRRLCQEDGGFRYMPDIPGDEIDGAFPESAGRAPLCALALHRGGAGSPEDVRRALEIFHKHKHSFRREWHKELCHTGPEGQGSHYLFYDYLFAAAAIRELPREMQATFRAELLQDILNIRYADGSYEDLPSLGRAYGTAMALLTFRELRSDCPPWRLP